MIALLSAVGSLLSFRVRSRASLELELIALRHQVTVLRRQRPGRPRLFSTDRLLWTWLYRIWPQVLYTMVLVKPATVVQWHRKGFRLYWRRRSRRLGRPGMSRESREMVRKMSLANPLWGAPRIHGELLKLAIEVSQATVGRYLPWRPKVPLCLPQTISGNNNDEVRRGSAEQRAGRAVGLADGPANPYPGTDAFGVRCNSRCRLQGSGAGGPRRRRRCDRGI